MARRTLEQIKQDPNIDFDRALRNILTKEIKQSKKLRERTPDAEDLLAKIKKSVNPLMIKVSDNWHPPKGNNDGKK